MTDISQRKKNRLQQLWGCPSETSRSRVILSCD